MAGILIKNYFKKFTEVKIGPEILVFSRRWRKCSFSLHLELIIPVSRTEVEKNPLIQNTFTATRISFVKKLLIFTT